MKLFELIYQQYRQQAIMEFAAEKKKPTEEEIGARVVQLAVQDTAKSIRS